MTNNISDLRFDAINFDGTTLNVFNGKSFTAADKKTGFGSGKKTVGTFTINGTRYENIAVDRLKVILGCEGTTANRTRVPATISGYCSRIVALFEEGTTRHKEVKKVCDSLVKLEAKYKAEDEAKAAEEDALAYLNGLSEDGLKALLAKVAKK